MKFMNGDTVRIKSDWISPEYPNGKTYHARVLDCILDESKRILVEYTDDGYTYRDRVYPSGCRYVRVDRDE